MAISIHKHQLDMHTITMKPSVCIIVLLVGQLLPGVRATGGTMGPVVSLVDRTYGNLTTVCALKSGTLVPTCMGALPAGTPTTQPMWALTAGETFICGLKYISHTPICWGTGIGVTLIPATYASTSYSTINAGRAHVCAVRDNSTLSPGTVDCWGDNNYEQALPPKNVPMLSVTSGDFYTCGIILATKKVLCWGNIDGTGMPSPPSNAQFKAIFSARLHMCGIRFDGYTECWSHISQDFTNPRPYSNFTSMAGTYDYTCAVQQPNHQMICWSPLNVAPTPMPYAISSLSASVYVKENSNNKVKIKNGYICGVREDIEVGNLLCLGTSPHSLANSLSSFSASKGICREKCLESQYPVLTDDECPNPDHKVCLDCHGACPSTNISITPHPPSIDDSNSSSPSTTGVPNSYNTTGSSSSPIWKVVVLISILLCCFVLVASLITFFIVRRKPGILGHLRLQEGSALIIFSHRQIRIATDNYTTIIGQGSYGKVYKGTLPNNQIVAVKKPHSPEAGKTYIVEFNILSKLNHPSVVEILGYCKKDNALVFPYMENGSLQDRMTDTFARKPLSDTKHRINIALQVAKGLSYIHGLGIIHRDVRSANILLDASWNAYITGFGISRLNAFGDATPHTNRVEGTPGYLDPDYYNCGELTRKSDVYSFGVVLLELASGLGPVGLADNARSLHSQGRLSNLVDQNLLQHYIDCRLSLVNIAMSCVKQSRVERPTMGEVVNQLETLNDLSLPSD